MSAGQPANAAAAKATQNGEVGQLVYSGGIRALGGSQNYNATAGFGVGTKVWEGSNGQSLGIGAGLSNTAQEAPGKKIPKLDLD